MNIQRSNDIHLFFRLPYPTFFTTALEFAVAVLFITMKKYSITKERPKHIAIYNYALIGNFILTLFINYSDYATLNVSFTARSIDAVLKTILVIGLIVRLGIAISVKKAWNKEKGLS